MQVTSNAISSIQAANTKTSPKANELEVSAAQPQTSIDKVEISAKGHVSSFVSQFSESEKAEFKDFMRSVRDSKQNGTFSAESLANNAPASFNKLSEHLGVSGQDLLANLPDKPPAQRAAGEQDSQLAVYANAQSNEQATEPSLVDKVWSWFES